MNTIIVALMLIAAFKMGESKGFKRNQQQQITSPEPKKTSTQKKASKKRKISADKEALEIMKEFTNYDDLFMDFKIIENSGGTTLYRYLENEYLFTVHRNPKIGVNVYVHKGKENLLTYKYSTSLNRFTEKYIVRSLIENFNRDEAMDDINNFIRKVVYQSSIWNRLDNDLVIKDDLKKVNPIYTIDENADNEVNETAEEEESSEVEKAEESTEDKSVSDNLVRLQNLIKQSESQMNSDVVAMFQTIIDNMRTCLTHIDRLETEKQHSLENLLQKDLEKLFLAYNELNNDSKEEIADKVTNALSIMVKETSYVLELFEQQNIREVEKMVQVIKTREY